LSLELDRELESMTGAYREEAPEEAEYPYAVFSARRLTEGDGIQMYTLEINVWDQGARYSRAEEMMDSLERKLHRCRHITGTGTLIRIFKGSRQNVRDPDPTIKRIWQQFEMHIYESEE